MTTYVLRENALVEVRRVAPRPRIHIQCDTMAPTWHPVADVMTDSLSHFRRMTEEAGCVEIGDYKAKPVETEPIEKSIETAIQMVNQGYKPRAETVDYAGNGDAITFRNED